jgi:hypothetical protein
MNTRTIAGAGAALALSITLVGGLPAVAKDGVVRNGSCSGAGVTKVKAGHDDGRIEVEGEVDTNRNGQNWRWRIVHDGKVAARGSARTHAPSGSFSVERRVANHKGKDRIVFRAVRPATGQVCRAVVNF